jgi:DNA replication protein DnaC
MIDTINETVLEKCRLLSLSAVVKQLEQTLKMAAQKNWSALQIIDHLFDHELERRRHNRIELRYKRSKLSEKITIDQFDFDYHLLRCTPNILVGCTIPVKEGTTRDSSPAG